MAVMLPSMLLAPVVIALWTELGLGGWVWAKLMTRSDGSPSILLGGCLAFVDAITRMADSIIGATQATKLREKRRELSSRMNMKPVLVAPAAAVAAETRSATQAVADKLKNIPLSIKPMEITSTLAGKAPFSSLTDAAATKMKQLGSKVWACGASPVQSGRELPGAKAARSSPRQTRLCGILIDHFCIA